MRVLFLTPSLGPGGAERLVIAYAHGLARRGMTVGIAFGDVASLQPLLRPRIQTFWLGDDALTPRTLHRWTPGIRDVVARFRPDVIYAHSVTAALAARLAARRLPLLVTVHGISPDDEAMAARLLRLSGARVTAVSLEAASGIGRHASAPPVEVIVPGVDTAALEEGAREPLEPLDPASPRFLCVARQHPAKGVDVLVRAFPRVLEQLPDARLLHIGAGSPDANRELAASLGVADRVTFAGLRLNVAPYLCAADVVVLPSRREGLPVAVLEALTLARPVVATAVGGTPTVIRPGETGWLVPP